MLYLRSKKSLIIDEAVLNDCEDRGEATSIILVVILMAIVMVRFSTNRIKKSRGLDTVRCMRAEVIPNGWLNCN